MTAIPARFGAASIREASATMPNPIPIAMAMPAIFLSMSFPHKRAQRPTAGLPAATIANPPRKGERVGVAKIEPYRRGPARPQSLRERKSSVMRCNFTMHFQVWWTTRRRFRSTSSTLADRFCFSCSIGCWMGRGPLGKPDWASRASSDYAKPERRFHSERLPARGSMHTSSIFVLSSSKNILSGSPRLYEDRRLDTHMPCGTCGMVRG